MPELRPYQKQAVDACFSWFREGREGNPVIVLPTGTGKSLVLASMAVTVAEKWHARTLILAHVKELLEQNADKVRKLCPYLKVGIYSAGLNRRDTDGDVIVAGIQSVANRAPELGEFKLILIDECHLVPLDGEGRYRSFLADEKLVSPKARLCGLTATPYRLSGGDICAPDNIFQHVCYEAGIREMIRQGYLTRLISRCGGKTADLSEAHIRNGEFIESEMSAAFDGDLTAYAVKEFVSLTSHRNCTLVFCASVRHAQTTAKLIEKHAHAECGVITGDTPPGEREHIIARLRGEKTASDLFGTPESPLKYVCNVGVLTTGFDAPNLDAIVLLRATASPGLLVQMCGRGTRLFEGKKDCLVLDYGGNFDRHGPIDCIRPPSHAKRGEGKIYHRKCPKCKAYITATCIECPECGYAIPVQERQVSVSGHYSGNVLSDSMKPIPDEVYEVKGVTYEEHEKKDSPDAPHTLQVNYDIGLGRTKHEWVCPEHTGYARAKFEKWWHERAVDSSSVPMTAAEAAEMAMTGALKKPLRITLHNDGKFDRVTRVETEEPLLFEPGAFNDDEDDQPTDAPGIPPLIDADCDIPF